MDRTTTRTSTRPLHDGWSFRELDPPEIPNSNPGAWMPAVVPGHVHVDLQREGVIPDPFARMHERGVQWVDERDWAYRCTFDAQPDGSRHLLRFEGLDTIATVLLNDAVIGAVDNMFIAHELDVTDALRTGANTLEVRFESAQRVGEQRLAAVAGDYESANGARTGLMPRSFVRKAQYMYGWDWGPRLRSCGIWQPVSLVRVPVARVRSWSWAATFRDDACDVVVHVEIEGDAECRVSLAGQTATGADAVITVDDPQRWWPAGQGDQRLYDLRIELTSGGDVVDAIDARIGLREIELVREPDEAGESFFFRVNGEAIFAKGANWIPNDSFPSRVTRDDLRTQLELARECGMNMLRIWGGGLYESFDFYDLCDELGLLVWQDFPFACAFYPEDDTFRDAFEIEARAAVCRLRNHTSLALWCGNNENQWLTWMGAFGGTRVIGAPLYDELLPEVVAEEDPTRAYWPSSPWGHRQNPSDDADGDCHYWNVWHGEGDWIHYSKCTARFVSEFGFAAAPDARTLAECLDPADLGVDTPGMRWHDKTRKGYETYLGYIGLHYPDPATLPDLVYYSQLNQADAMRYGIEHFRRLRPHTMGTLVWQLNDCWPVQSWAWIDHRDRPKAAWYAAKRFYAPLLLSLTRAGDRITAHLVNDDRTPRDGQLDVRAVADDGSVLWSTSVRATAPAASSVQVFDAELPPDVRGASTQAVIHATFADVSSTLLLCEPKELRLPVPHLRVGSTPTEGGAQLVLETATLALSVMLTVDDPDARWSDNFIDVFPGEPRALSVTSDEPYAQLVASVRWRSL